MGSEVAMTEAGEANQDSVDLAKNTSKDYYFDSYSYFTLAFMKKC